MKKLIIFLMILVLIPGVLAICCERNDLCTITEVCQDDNCGDCQITVFNRDGSVNISISNMELITSSTYLFNKTENISINFGTYPYRINCTTEEVCQGQCAVEVKRECEEEQRMEIVIFLVLFGLGLVLVAFMHFFKEDVSSVAYGFTAMSLFVLLGAALLFGWKAILLEMSLPFDINKLMGVVCMVIGLYSAWFSVALWQFMRREQQKSETDESGAYPIFKDR